MTRFYNPSVNNYLESEIFRYDVKSLIYLSLNMVKQYFLKRNPVELQ